MRLKDSSTYLYLSILLCRISLIPTLITASPGMVISIPQQVDIQPPLVKKDNSQYIHSHPSVAAAGSAASSQLLIPHENPRGKVTFYPHSNDQHVNSKDLEAFEGIPTTKVNTPSKSSRKGKLVKRVWDDNGSGPVIESEKPEFHPIALSILSTVDGDLHCINTANGDVIWRRPSKVTGAIVSSNITTYLSSSSRDRNRNDDLDNISGSARSQLDGEDDGEDDHEYDSKDWMFIVEPSDTPKLYVYSHKSGLQ
ncbi:hypothetical protein BGZ46_004129, partial [Entomortierella lignicola]